MYSKKLQKTSIIHSFIPPLSCYVTIVYIRFLSKKNIRIIGTIIFFAIFLAHTLYIFFSSKITSLFLFYSSKKVTFFTQIRTLLLHSTYDWYTYFFTPYTVQFQLIYTLILFSHREYFFWKRRESLKNFFCNSAFMMTQDCKLIL